MRIVERRVPRHGPVLVKLEDGRWIPEDEYGEDVSESDSDVSDEEE